MPLEKYFKVLHLAKRQFCPRPKLPFCLESFVAVARQPTEAPLSLLAEGVGGADEL